MKVNWTNDDRGAFGEFLASSLGRKFIQFLEQERPEFPETTDLTAMALSGAVAKGYDALIKKIDGMARLPTPAAPKIEFVEVEKD
jgi:hypothetical protein